MELVLSSRFQLSTAKLPQDSRPATFSMTIHHFTNGPTLDAKHTRTNTSEGFCLQTQIYRLVRWLFNRCVAMFSVVFFCISVWIARENLHKFWIRNTGWDGRWTKRRQSAQRERGGKSCVPEMRIANASPTAGGCIEVIGNWRKSSSSESPTKKGFCCSNERDGWQTSQT